MESNEVIRSNITDTEMLAFGCIHCGKTIFKISENFFMSGINEYLFECPRCKKTMTLNNKDELKPGISVDEWIKEYS